MSSERFVPVDGHPGFVRDKRSGAIVNINKKEMQAAKEKKLKRRQQKEDFDNLKQEVSEIKQMLLLIAEKIK